MAYIAPLRKLSRKQICDKMRKINSRNIKTSLSNIRYYFKYDGVDVADYTVDFAKKIFKENRGKKFKLMYCNNLSITVYTSHKSKSKTYES